MKNNRFKLGDRIISEDGDIGTVLKIDRRPDTPEGQMGVYAFWKKEKMAFWMDLEDPSIKICEKDSWMGNLNIN